jgi:hypothetical protein
MKFYQLLLIFLARKFQKYSKIIFILVGLFVTLRLYSFLKGFADKTTKSTSHWSIMLESDVYNDLNISTGSYRSEYTQTKVSYTRFNQRFLLNSPDKVSAYARLKTVIPHGRALSSLNKQNYVILEYTKVFGQSRFCDSGLTGRDIFLSECPHTNCEFTCDRARAFEADALLFHEADIYREPTEDMVFLKTVLARRAARRKQVWILWNDEAWQVKKSLNALKFNWVSAGSSLNSI